MMLTQDVLLNSNHKRAAMCFRDQVYPSLKPGRVVPRKTAQLSSSVAGFEWSHLSATHNHCAWSLAVPRNVINVLVALAFVITNLKIKMRNCFESKTRMASARSQNDDRERP